ncbi:MAG: protein kinase [Chloroflexota bacterium]
MTIPTTIGRYEIQRELGRGGMATVFLAHDPVIGREVAVKVLPREFLHDTHFRGRFEREVKTIAALDHPYIVPVYDSGMEGEQPYLVMRYMAGGSLKDRLEQEPIPYTEAILILNRIATALDEAHAHDIIHRDLKPANILFDQRGEAFLSDFGIVKLAQSTATYTGSGIIGTPAYMSPEQVYGDRELDGRSDIYSLGVLLYQMLTGKMPYAGDTPAKQMMAHVIEPVPDILSARPDLPTECQTVIEKALAKEPNGRFDTASHLVTALTRPEPFWLPPRDEPQPAPSPTKSWPVWGLVVGGIAVLLLVAALLRGGGDATATATPNGTATFIAAQLQIPATSTDTPRPSATPTATSTTRVETAVTTPPDTATPTATQTPTHTPSPTPSVTPDKGPEAGVLGQSAGGNDIEMMRFGNGPGVVIFIGGISAGFAPSSVAVMEEAITYFQENPTAVPAAITLYIIPRLNPDSSEAPGELDGRINANGVDLNRNWDCRWRSDPNWRGERVEGLGGSTPFSEPETDALAEFILAQQPVAVVIWQARINNGLISPGACGLRPIASEPLARTYSLASGYEVADYEDLVSQEVNGDSVNWVDWQGFPAITVLLPDYDDMDWESNLRGITAVLQTSTN